MRWAGWRDSFQYSYATHTERRPQRNNKSHARLLLVFFFCFEFFDIQRVRARTPKMCGWWYADDDNGSSSSSSMAPCLATYNFLWMVRTVKRALMTVNGVLARTRASRCYCLMCETWGRMTTKVEEWNKMKIKSNVMKTSKRWSAVAATREQCDTRKCISRRFFLRIGRYSCEKLKS